MWDAQNQYWEGYSSSQPKLSTLPANSNYAQGSSDANYRWYHEGGGAFQASQSCATLPNVNEMTWYAVKGDPRWDADELWTTMGHLYKGGMWFKKKANINGFNANTAVDGNDWRTINTNHIWSASNTLPSAVEVGNYFYLPALGFYRSGQLDNIGVRGYYWSSSANPLHSNYAYNLDFSNGNVCVLYGYRYHGYNVGMFE